MLFKIISKENVSASNINRQLCKKTMGRCTKFRRLLRRIWYRHFRITMPYLLLPIAEVDIDPSASTVCKFDLVGWSVCIIYRESRRLTTPWPSSGCWQIAIDCLHLVPANPSVPYLAPSRFQYWNYPGNPEPSLLRTANKCIKYALFPARKHDAFEFAVSRFERLFWCTRKKSDISTAHRTDCQ